MSEMTMKLEYVGLQDQVLAHVKDMPGESPREIADYLEADRSSVTRALSRLKARGLVTAVDGEYTAIYYDLGELVRSAFGPENQFVPPARSTWYRRWRRLARLGGWILPALALVVLSYFAGYYDWASWLVQG